MIGQQNRKTFGFSYVTTLGNDTELNEYGYKIHLIYGASVSPSERSYETINDSPEPINFSWEFTTVPVPVSVVGGNYKATSLLTIESTKFKTEAEIARLQNFEDVLYGSDGTATYTEFTGNAFVEGTTYYERSGEEGSYVYTPTSDTTKSGSKTYYTKSVSGVTTARLPLPEEVVTILAPST